MDKYKTAMATYKSENGLVEAQKDVKKSRRSAVNALTKKPRAAKKPAKKAVKKTVKKAPKKTVVKKAVKKTVKVIF
jgi:hypothetical protein